MGILLIIVGLLVAIVGNIWFLVEAFRENVLWGLGCLIVPFVSLGYLFVHWDRAAKPFGIAVLGWCLIFGGVAMSPKEVPDQTASAFTDGQ